jgi:putative DNA primase/helicase
VKKFAAQSRQEWRGERKPMYAHAINKVPKPQSDDAWIDALNSELQLQSASEIGEVQFYDDDGRDAADSMVARLAALSLSEYERLRKDAADKLGFRASVLDKLVDAQRLLQRPSDSDDWLQGKAVKLADVEPWPDAVNGGEVLDVIAKTFAQYVALPDGAADALALWCAHTHCYRSFLCSPRLNISSPEKGCGKTTLRDVVAFFVPRPLLTENLTTAVLFRLVDSQSPTLLADEVDGWLQDNEDLRSLLNAGHRQGAMVFRCEGDNNEVRGFAAYAPAVLCGIGALPTTLHDRSLVIRLERAKRGEIQARFDSRHTEVENELCRKLARWCADNRAQLEASDPKLPDGVFNREADNWRPLFAIAEIAGGDWWKRSADALAKLTKRGSDDVEGLRVMLLADIQQIFAGTWPPLAEGEQSSPEERKFSRDLVEVLAEMRERPWPELCRGKPITERWLARNLGAFGIRPKLLRIGDDWRPARGYDKEDFEDAFTRYLPEGGFASVTPLQHEAKSENSIRYKNENVTDEKTARYIGNCNTVTDKKREKSKMDESDPF